MRKSFLAPMGAMLLVSMTFVGCGDDTKQLVNITGPSDRQCNDGNDNDGDGLIDFPQDPGCVSFDDNTESPNPTGNVDPPTTGLLPPGDFTLNGSCVNGRARLSWTTPARTERLDLYRRLWTTGALLKVAEIPIGNNSYEHQADATADNYWRIVAVNAAGSTGSMSPLERDDKTVLFACGKPAMACNNGRDDDLDGKIDRNDPGCSYPQGYYDENDNDETDPPVSGPSPTPPPTTGPGPVTPHPGSCTATGYSAPQTSGNPGQQVQLVASPAGCSAIFRSSHPDNVLVSRDGLVTFITRGVPQQCSTITVNHLAGRQFCTN